MMEKWQQTYSYEGVLLFYLTLNRDFSEPLGYGMLVLVFKFEYTIS